MSRRSSRPIQGHGRLRGDMGRVELRNVPIPTPIPVHVPIPTIPSPVPTRTRGPPASGPAEARDPRRAARPAARSAAALAVDRVMWTGCNGAARHFLVLPQPSPYAALLGCLCPARSTQVHCPGMQGGKWQMCFPPAPLSEMQGVMPVLCRLRGSAQLDAPRAVPQRVLPGLGPCSPCQAVGVPLG